MKTKPISEPALAVLSGLEFTDTTAKITGGQLDRKLYVEVNAALEALGGKWNRKAGAHTFPGDPKPLIDDLIDAGGYVDQKKALGFFETPPEIAERMAAWAAVQAGELVMDPSVGHGALLRPLASTPCVITAFDIAPERDPELSKLVRRLPPLSFLGEFRDFLTVNPKDFRPVDVVLMNPPFARQQDIAHIIHALAFLKPGGRLAAIASGSVTYRQDKRAVAFRELVAAHGGTIEPLPEGAFKASGTSVRTVLITLTKKVLR